MKIWLDDERKEPEGWLRAKTAWEMISLLNIHSVEEISLDHDLGDDKNFGTGLDVLKWIEEAVHTSNFTAPKIKIHSMNPVGRKNMLDCLSAIERFSAQKEEL